MKVVEAIVLLSVGVFIGVIATYSSKCLPGSSPKHRISKHQKAFFLGITIKFNALEDKQKFMDIFGPYAKFVAATEMETISYELSESDKSNLQIFLVERYTSKEAYLEIHRTSEEFIVFRAKLTELGAAMTMDGHSYIESNLGFI